MFIASTMPVGACAEVAPSQDRSVPPPSWSSGATTMLIYIVRCHRKLTISMVWHEIGCALYLQYLA